MTFYICVQDIFGYCSTNPRIKPKRSNPLADGPNLPTGGACSKNPAKCPSFETNAMKNLPAVQFFQNRRTTIAKKGTKKQK